MEIVCPLLRRVVPHRLPSKPPKGIATQGIWLTRRRQIHRPGIPTTVCLHRRRPTAVIVSPWHLHHPPPTALIVVLPGRISGVWDRRRLLVRPRNPHRFHSPSHSSQPPATSHHQQHTACPTRPVPCSAPPPLRPPHATAASSSSRQQHSRQQHSRQQHSRQRHIRRHSNKHSNRRHNRQHSNKHSSKHNTGRLGYRIPPCLLVSIRIRAAVKALAVWRSFSNWRMGSSISIPPR